MPDDRTEFSAAEPGLGYIFQSRFALLRSLDLPEDHVIFFERNDDVEFVATADGTLSLASLKHKAPGDRLTDLSVDFWKSVRVWLNYYNGNGASVPKCRFALYHTGEVSSGSFLELFTDGSEADDERKAGAAVEAINRTRSAPLLRLKTEIEKLSLDSISDFFGRITIYQKTERIEEIPTLIDQRLRTVRREARAALFERLEGWWTDNVIKILAGERQEPISIQEVSDKLSSLADEYKNDNLPINFGHKTPKDIDPIGDQRIFVRQLHALRLSEDRVRFAIIDYYRAFEQRSSWARENLLVSNEIEEYEDKLVEEWARYKAVVCEDLLVDSQEDALVAAGRELFRWAERETGQLRIRERVSEPYVVRGTFHILANGSPKPRVHWHPHFMVKLAEMLEVAA